MKDLFHTNISFNATSKMELYKIWDSDLKSANKKRDRWEWVVGISVLFIIFGDTILLKTSFIGVAIYAGLQVIEHFIEEAQINYLMHKIDIDELGLRE